MIKIQEQNDFLPLDTTKFYTLDIKAYLIKMRQDFSHLEKICVGRFGLCKYRDGTFFGLKSK